MLYHYNMHCVCVCVRAGVHLGDLKPGQALAVPQVLSIASCASCSTCDKDDVLMLHVRAQECTWATSSPARHWQCRRCCPLLLARTTKSRGEKYEEGRKVQRGRGEK
jgi:hypothetical protein